MYEFKAKPRYATYRKKRIPYWWLDYLPDEKNPYTEKDVLYLPLGCLNEYWHTHSSNKHYSFKGTMACNFVQELVKECYGEAFLVGKQWACHQGEKFYHNDKDIKYPFAEVHLHDTKNSWSIINMYEKGYIKITNAYMYYEDVIRFILSVLEKVSQMHYPPPQYGGDNGEKFFEKYYGRIED